MVDKNKSKESAKTSVKESTGPPLSPEDVIKAVKAEKNQFAINRLIMILMDFDPANLSQDTINDLKQVYIRLVNILNRQTVPDQHSTKESAN